MHQESVLKWGRGRQREAERQVVGADSQRSREEPVCMEKEGGKASSSSFLLLPTRLQQYKAGRLLGDQQNHVRKIRSGFK